MQKIKLNNKATVLLNYKDGKFCPMPQAGGGNELEKRAVSFEEFTVANIVDVPVLKIVYASLFETVIPVVLWRGEDYNQIGQWTDEQAMNKLSEILNSYTNEEVEKLFDIMSIENATFPDKKIKQELINSISPDERKKIVFVLPRPNQNPSFAN